MKLLSHRNNHRNCSLLYEHFHLFALVPAVFPKLIAEGYIVGKLSPAFSLGVAILCASLFKGTSYKNYWWFHLIALGYQSLSLKIEVEVL